MRNRLTLAVALGLAVASPAVGQAGTATTTMAITATIPQACTVSAGALAFGNYSSASGTSATANVTVTCQSSDSVTIDLDAGAHGTLNGQSTTRAMAAGTSQLSYNLYTNNTHTNVWATGAGNDVTGTANLTLVSPVYGFIPASQTAGAGSYTDTVNVTLTY